MCDILNSITNAIDIAKKHGTRLDVKVVEGLFMTTVNIDFSSSYEYNNYCDPDEQEKYIDLVLKTLRDAKKSGDVIIGYEVRYNKRLTGSNC